MWLTLEAAAHLRLQEVQEARRGHEGPAHRRVAQQGHTQGAAGQFRATALGQAPSASAFGLSFENGPDVWESAALRAASATSTAAAAAACAIPYPAPALALPPRPLVQSTPSTLQRPCVARLPTQKGGDCLGVSFSKKGVRSSGFAHVRTFRGKTRNHFRVVGHPRCVCGSAWSRPCRACPGQG